VSEKSVAEGLGVRVGDIVTCVNGECISDTVEVGLSLKINHVYVGFCNFCCYQLENMLLSMCEAHFDQGHRLNSKMNVKVRLPLCFNVDSMPFIQFNNYQIVCSKEYNILCYRLVYFI
jgi:hypothetical protein